MYKRKSRGAKNPNSSAPAFFSILSILLETPEAYNRTEDRSVSSVRPFRLLCRRTHRFRQRRIDNKVPSSRYLRFLLGANRLGMPCYECIVGTRHRRLGECFSRQHSVYRSTREFPSHRLIWKRLQPFCSKLDRGSSLLSTLFILICV